MTSNTKDDKPTVELEKDGPLKVTGLGSFFNSRGEEIATKKTVILCRCGASRNKPFCDGTHSQIVLGGGDKMQEFINTR